MPLVCPEYRIRLFLSVDLVGSTAFKSNVQDEVSEKSCTPIWMQVLKHFYQDFPKSLARNFTALAAVENGRVPDSRPNVWKTVGDEIIFCCRLKDRVHLKVCIDSFLRTLNDYGLYLDSQKHKLDVKGSAWIAPFPAPNVTISLDGVDQRAGFDELKDEALELQADINPRSFDFLGKHIDTGFRITRFAEADQMVVSLELSLLIAEIYQDTLTYNYLGRHLLKGVLFNRPYPVVTVVTERNADRKILLDRERTLIPNNRTVGATQLADFLRTFIQHEQIEFPNLARLAGDPLEEQIGYIEFKRVWTAEQTELQKRTANEDRAAETQSDSGDSQTLPDAVNEQLSEVTEGAG